jgi:hypothetical protein
MSSTREHLLGYLLGALEPAEMEEVERELENNPQLRRDLAAIEAALTPLGFPEREDDASFEPPPVGLVARTCEFVEDAKEDLIPRAMPVKDATPMSSEVALAPRGRMRWADVVVTGSVLLAALALIFPAILASRQSTQIAACQDNLRHLGLAVSQAAGMASDGRIPAIPVSGNRSTAGIYSALLQDKQLLDEPGRLVCPSSDLAERASTFRIPTLGEIDRAAGEALVNLQLTMGGSYAYNLGYLENGEYKAPKYAGRSHYALMSDAPVTFRPERRTNNHSGRGQNILSEDGAVKFVVDPCHDLADDPYFNRSGLVAAGVDCADVVLGESIAKPIPAAIRVMQ